MGENLGITELTEAILKDIGIPKSHSWGHSRSAWIRDTENKWTDIEIYHGYELVASLYPNSRLKMVLLRLEVDPPEGGGLRGIPRSTEFASNTFDLTHPSSLDEIRAWLTIQFPNMFPNRREE